MRDMVMAMGVLVVALLVVVGAYGGFSFGVGDTSGTVVPTADVTGGFAHAEDSLGFPIAVPQGLPDTWQPNSFTVTNPEIQGGDGIPAARGGWLTASGRFITLVQSSATQADLVTQEVGRGLGSRGAVDAGGATWSIYPGMRDELAWVRTKGAVTYLITGAAGEDDFRLLAASIA